MRSFDEARRDEGAEIEAVSLEEAEETTKPQVAETADVLDVSVEAEGSISDKDLKGNTSEKTEEPKSSPKKRLLQRRRSQ